MKKIAIVLSAATFLMSCSGTNNKKVTIFAKGEISVDEDKHSVTVKGSSGHSDKTATFNSADPVSLKLKTDDKETTIEVPTNGYYVVNAKSDTIIGSYQNFSAPKEQGLTVTQDMLLRSIDSLEQLVAGKVSATNKTYFLTPYSSFKLTDNIDAQVVAPYHQLNAVEKKGDKEPEVYRFWSINEIREKIAKQKELTILEKKAPK